MHIVIHSDHILEIHDTGVMVFDSKKRVSFFVLKFSVVIRITLEHAYLVNKQ